MNCGTALAEQQRARLMLLPLIKYSLTGKQAATNSAANRIILKL